MRYVPNKHRRRSIRLRGHDYSQTGAYFITICTHDRQCQFGKIIDGEMMLNEYGKIVADEWINTSKIRTGIELDIWVVMPNHFHGIVVITRRGTARRAPTTCRAPAREQFGKPVAGSLSTIVRAFKSAVTKRINETRHTPGEKIWQRNYWEHIVRDENEWQRIQQYILSNPAKWEMDRNYPGDPSTVRETTAEYGHEPWMV